MIDHLVLGTPDVTVTSAGVAAAWGVTVVTGGQHVGRGTRNELTGLGGGTYLEIVGPDATQPDPSGPRPFGVDELRDPLLVTWCARPDRPLDEVRDELARLGLDPGPATPMSRARPDGVVLDWTLTVPHLGPPHGGVVPFLINWGATEPPALSLPHEATLVTLRLHHPDPALVSRVLAALGDDDRLEVAEGRPQLTAVIESPHGVVTL